MTFGERLAEMMDDRDMTPRRLAKRMSAGRITYSTTLGYLNRATKGEYLPSVEDLLRWCGYLELSDEQTEELVARRMAERYGCGDAWEMWAMPAARVIQEVRS